MTRAEKDILLEKLFTEFDDNIKENIQILLQKYEDTHHLFPNVPEASFGIKFCKLILSQKDKRKPNYKYLMSKTYNKQTSYYKYRETILEHINSFVN